MSAIPNTPTTTRASLTSAGRSRSTLIRWIAVGLALAAIIAAVAIAVWPDSPADKARADGEHLGQAVGSLYYAQDTAEADAALADIDAALNDTRAHAGDELASQIDQQAEALDHAVNGFVGTHTTDDAWDAELYQAELNAAVDDLIANADDFQSQHSEVRQAYYEGFQDGLPSDLR